MATTHHIAKPSRSARTHLRRIYAVEAAIREALDDIHFGKVSGESCAGLRRVLGNLEAAVALLDGVRMQERSYVG